MVLSVVAPVWAIVVWWRSADVALKSLAHIPGGLDLVTDTILMLLPTLEPLGKSTFLPHGVSNPIDKADSGIRDG